MRPLIQVQHFSKLYQLGQITVQALNDVSLKIERGEFVAVMGPSGSGKSTFVNLLGCLDRPSSGRYLLDGTPVESFDRDQLAEIRNRKIGFVFQNFNLLPRMTAQENVILPLMYTDQATGDADKLAAAALAAVGLTGREDSMPSQLSGGQQQRVAIARALVNSPEIILADEPTGQLDSRTSEEIMNLFRNLNRTRAITVIVVTHSDEVAAYARRIIRFRDGAVVADDAVPSNPTATLPLEEVVR